MARDPRSDPEPFFCRQTTEATCLASGAPPVVHRVLSRSRPARARSSSRRRPATAAPAGRGAWRARCPPRRDDRRRRRHLRRRHDRHRRDGRRVRAVARPARRRADSTAASSATAAPAEARLRTACADGWTCETNQCVGGASLHAADLRQLLRRDRRRLRPQADLQHAARRARVPRRHLRRSGLRPAHLRRPPNNVRYCGTIGDGCGGTLDCGTCPNGGTCGGPATTRTSATTRPARSSRARRWAASTAARSATAAAARRTAARARTAWPARRPARRAHICPGSTTTAARRPARGAAPRRRSAATVYDPAGVNPLYNVIVYIPTRRSPLAREGVSCDRCGAAGQRPVSRRR